MDLVWTIAIILIVLWIFGLLGSIGGSIIHGLVVIALILIVYRLVQGRNLLSKK